MGDVIKLKGEAPVRGPEAVARVVQFLREQADRLESGEAAPVHKAVLTVYEDCGDQFRVLSVFCNVTAIERAGITAMALRDMTETD